MTSPKPPPPVALSHEMLEAFRGDLVDAANQWCDFALADTSRGSGGRVKTALQRVDAHRALDRAHPFLPRHFVQRLKAELTEASLARSGTSDTVAVSSIVAGILAEAELEASQQAEALKRVHAEAATAAYWA
ncbi:hypothetical protein [Rhizobacter sp. Root1221]|uniref:hypothetical protein n=1 Tax=Rhizobacter sp. Root1221 TaxID=1736433 RepID=UPI0012FB4448|nr:hypothetical protein [Rhizobacter sp. Root1221]